MSLVAIKGRGGDIGIRVEGGNEAGLKPCGHRVLVRPIPVERKTEAGIILADIAADREDMAQIKAEVIEIGPLCWKDQPGKEPWCKVGDVVLIAKFAGLFHRGPNEKTYRVISDLDVVAVVGGGK